MKGNRGLIAGPLSGSFWARCLWLPNANRAHRSAGPPARCPPRLHRGTRRRARVHRLGNPTPAPHPIVAHYRAGDRRACGDLYGRYQVHRRVHAARDGAFRGQPRHRGAPRGVGKRRHGSKLRPPPRHGSLFRRHRHPFRREGAGLGGARRPGRPRACSYRLPYHRGPGGPRRGPAGLVRLPKQLIAPPRCCADYPHPSSRLWGCASGSPFFTGSL